MFLIQSKKNTPLFLEGVLGERNGTGTQENAVMFEKELKKKKKTLKGGPDGHTCVLS